MMVERDMRPAVDAWLRSRGMVETLWEAYLCQNADLVGVRFAPRVGRAIPPIEQCIVVELKMRDIAGVLRQAKRHRNGYPVESYAAMPSGFVARMRDASIERFRASGVGLLSVHGGAVDVVVAADVRDDKEWGVYRPKRLWRRVSELTRPSRTMKKERETP